MSESTDGVVARVLLADDDGSFRYCLGALLQREGYRYEGAADATEARKLLAESEFDALVCDIDMPGNSELELIESIPQVAKGLPVILLTGQPSVNTAAKSVRLPVAAYLIKPPDLQELLGLLRDHIANYRCHQTIVASRARLREWDRELERLESSRTKKLDSTAGARMAELMLSTLRNTVMTLMDMERALHRASQMSPKGEGMNNVALVGALRHTVEVLDRTKQHFKSKDLGALRMQLEGLLKPQPDPQSPLEPPPA